MVSVRAATGVRPGGIRPECVNPANEIPRDLLAGGRVRRLDRTLEVMRLLQVQCGLVEGFGSWRMNEERFDPRGSERTLFENDKAFQGGPCWGETCISFP